MYKYILTIIRDPDWIVAETFLSCSILAEAKPYHLGLILSEYEPHISLQIGFLIFDLCKSA